MKFFKKFFSKEDTSKPPSDNHPIPLEALETIDIIARKVDGGVDLIIVSSGYLDDSDYTHQRIVDKVQNYLCFIQSEEYKQEFGEPSVEKTLITLKYSQAHESVFELIESLKPQVEKYHVSLVIEPERASQFQKIQSLEKP